MTPVYRLRILAFYKDVFTVMSGYDTVGDLSGATIDSLTLGW
jgi:hypothetical protein